MRAPLLAGTALIIVTTLALVSVACPDPDRAPRSTADGRSAGPAQVAAPEDPSTVVARIGDEEITLGQVDEELAAELAQVELEHRQRIYELRSAGIERFIATKLFAEEAARMGFDDEETYIMQTVEKGTPFPSEEQVRAFYEQNKQMMGEQSFEQVQPRVTQFLHQRAKQERFNSLLDEMREKAEVKILLSEPRVQVEAKGPSKGPDDALVTIVEFTDFLCPFCARGKEVMEQVREEYGEDVRLVFRLFPTMENELAATAAVAAACADEQDKFWQMHETLFLAGQQLSAEDLARYAGAIEGLDTEDFAACMESEEVHERIMADISAGRSAGVGGTPAYFVNGIPVLGAQPFETFKEIIDEELERARAAKDTE